jgi:hypothetical protein
LRLTGFGLTTPIDRKQRSRHRTTGHCLQTIQAKTSETQNISMEKSRYLQDKGRSRIIWNFKECLVGFDWILSIYDGLFFPVDIG